MSELHNSPEPIAYNYHVVRQFTLMTLVWGVLGMGMGAVIMSLTIGMAVFKGAMVGGLRKALPYIEPVGSWLMVAAGSYIVFYWLTLGGLL